MSKKMSLFDRCYSRLWRSWSGYTGGLENVSLKGNGDALCESVRLVLIDMNENKSKENEVLLGYYKRLWTAFDNLRGFSDKKKLKGNTDAFIEAMRKLTIDMGNQLNELGMFDDDAEVE